MGRHVWRRACGWIGLAVLGLTLCWDPNVEPDLSHYRIQFAERHITGWVACPTLDDPAAICPVYSPFLWTAFEPVAPEFVSPPCAEQPGDFCVYTHPTAVDLSGNESTQPMLLWPPPFPGSCP
jgi:hypothetical protein